LFFFVVRTASTLSSETRVDFETTVYRVKRKKEKDKLIVAYFFTYMRCTLVRFN
jgi:hypothetical protein